MVNKPLMRPFSGGVVLWFVYVVPLNPKQPVESGWFVIYNHISHGKIWFIIQLIAKHL